MNEQVLEYIKYGLWILFGSGLLFEITPIKIKPLSFILSGIGKRLNKDVKENISKLQADIEFVRKDLQDHTVESQRRDILNFANALSRGERKTEEHFNYILAIHDRYEKYTEQNKIKNSQADLAFNYISSMYQEYRKNNSFYVGKQGGENS